MRIEYRVVRKHSEDIHEEMQKSSFLGYAPLRSEFQLFSQISQELDNQNKVSKT